MESVRRANVARLREKYRDLIEEETRSLHREHLFSLIAWRLQARAEGGLSDRALKRAQEIADEWKTPVISGTYFGGTSARVA